MINVGGGLECAARDDNGEAPRGESKEDSKDGGHEEVVEVDD